MAITSRALILILVTVFCASASGSELVAEFVAALVKHPPNLSRAIAICESNSLPAHANLRIPAAGTSVGSVSHAVMNRESSTREATLAAAQSRRLEAFLIELLPEAPEVINLLACVVQKRVVDVKSTSDKGAQLLYVAATKKHVRLTHALLESSAPLNHTDVADASATTLHAALQNRVFALDIVSKVLLARAKNGDDVSWLSALGQAIAAHMGSSAQSREVKDAVDALTRVALGSKDSSVAVRASDAHALGNGLSFLLLRLLLDGLRRKVQDSSKADQTDDVQGVHVAFDGAASTGSPGSSQAAPRMAAIQHALALLQTPDRYGRTPLHIAASTGNSAAIVELCKTMYALLLSGAEVGTSGNAAKAALRVARYVQRKDARGLTAMQLACTGGHITAASTLEQALSQLSPEKGDPTSSPVAKPIDHSSRWTLQPPLQLSWEAAEAFLGLPRLASCAALVHTPAGHTRGPRSKSDSSSHKSAPTSTPLATLDPALGLSNGGWRVPMHRHSPDHIATKSERAINATLLRAAQRWNLSEHACDIDVVDGPQVSSVDFYNHFVLRSRPVLLKHLALHWPLRAAWTFDELSSGQAGGTAFGSVGRVPYEASFSTNTTYLMERTTLATFIRDVLYAQEEHCTRGTSPDCLPSDDAPYYVFDSPTSRASLRAIQGDEVKAAGAIAALLAPLTLVPAFLDYNVTVDRGVTQGIKQRYEAARAAFEPPQPQLLASSSEAALVAAFEAASGGDALVLALPEPKPQFFLGPPGSGAPLHWHKDAWNVVAWGRKHWWMLPPVLAVYSAQPPVEWAAEPERVFAGLGPGGSDLRPLECVQEAGDVLYVPAGWAHAVLNTEVTVGAAVELSFAGRG
jgi:ankyrin repeat protein